MTSKYSELNAVMKETTGGRVKVVRVGINGHHTKQGIAMARARAAGIEPATASENSGHKPAGKGGPLPRAAGKNGNGPLKAIVK